MVGQARREQSETATYIHASRIAFGIGRGIVRESGSFIDAHAFAHRHVGDRGHVVLDRSDQADRMGVIGQDQNERIVAVRSGPITGKLDRIVEHDRIIHCAFHIEEVRVLVDHAGFHHQEETGFVPGENLQRRADFLGQIRLFRKFPDGSTLEDLAIEGAVHVAEREHPTSFVVFGSSASDVISAPVEATE